MDVLFNNAGGGHFLSIEETAPEQLHYVVSVNLDSVFFGMQAAIEVMKQSGGAIVNNSSIAAMVGELRRAAYSATEGGVRAMTKAVAADCARKGYPIRINSIHPGYTETRLVAKLLQSIGDRTESIGAALVSAIPPGAACQPGGDCCGRSCFSPATMPPT